ERLVGVAVRLVESLLDVEHARAGLLAQRLDVSGGVVRHGGQVPCSLVVRGRGAQTCSAAGASPSAAASGAASSVASASAAGASAWAAACSASWACSSSRSHSASGSAAAASPVLPPARATRP